MSNRNPDWTLTEALKAQKLNLEKIEKTMRLVRDNCALLESEESPYSDPWEKIKEWMQSVHDLIEFQIKIGESIKHTNLITAVTISEGFDKPVTRSIEGWMMRRGTRQRAGLARLEASLWNCLTNRHRETTVTRNEKGEESYDKVRLFFDTEEKDRMLDRFTSESSIIDGKLEVVNATTKVIWI